MFPSAYIPTLNVVELSRTLGKYKSCEYVGMGAPGFWSSTGGIEIGNDTIIGNYVSFHSANHNFQLLDTPIRLQGVI